MRKRVGVVLMTIALVVPAASADQGRSQGRGRGSGGDTRPGDPTNATTVNLMFTFSDRDRDTFRTYFAKNKVTATALPPGIAKNVARGKPLPPGIAKKALPADLVLTLGPRAQPGVTFAIYGDRVVALRNGLVIDVLVGVFK